MTVGVYGFVFGRDSVFGLALICGIVKIGCFLDKYVKVIVAENDALTKWIAKLNRFLGMIYIKDGSLLLRVDGYSFVLGFSWAL